MKKQHKIVPVHEVAPGTYEGSITIEEDDEEVVVCPRVINKKEVKEDGQV